MSKMSNKKRPIRDFMQKHYTDERLAMLLAHAQSGRLSYDSCCCFAGIKSANHAFLGHRQYRSEGHDIRGFDRTFWEGSKAFCYLGDDNVQRRRILIPMIRAEMWRRAKLRKVSLAAELNQPESTRQSMEKVLKLDVTK